MTFPIVNVESGFLKTAELYTILYDFQLHYDKKGNPCKSVTLEVYIVHFAESIIGGGNKVYEILTDHSSTSELRAEVLAFSDTMSLPLAASDPSDSSSSSISL